MLRPEQVVLCIIQVLIAAFFLYGAWLEPQNLGLALVGAVTIPFLFTWLYSKAKDSILWATHKLARSRRL